VFRDVRWNVKMCECTIFSEAWPAIWDVSASVRRVENSLGYLERFLQLCFRFTVTGKADLFSVGIGEALRRCWTGFGRAAKTPGRVGPGIVILFEYFYTIYFVLLCILPNHPPIF
jgi:hypothetical protein